MMQKIYRHDLKPNKKKLLMDNSQGWIYLKCPGRIFLLLTWKVNACNETRKIRYCKQSIKKLQTFM